VVAETGIAAFAHLGTSPVSDEALKSMQDRKIPSITTLAVHEALSRRRLADLGFLKHPLVADVMPSRFIEELSAYARKSLSADEDARAERSARRLSIAMENAKRLLDAGVMLVAGTDSPYPGDYYGEGLHRELELLVEAGLTPLQALTASTKNGAALMNQEEEWGTLTVGRRADILIVNGNPARQIRDSRNVETVIQNGRIIDRTALKLGSRKDADFHMAPVYSSGK
jgi:imidazolonepropionase-like amidohydrolase